MHCPACNGSGLAPGARRLVVAGVRRDCESCGGSGSIADVLLEPAPGLVHVVCLFADGTVGEMHIPRRLAGQRIVTARGDRVENVELELHHVEGGVFHYEEGSSAEKVRH